MVYTLCGLKRPSLRCSKSWLVPRIQRLIGYPKATATEIADRFDQFQPAGLPAAEDSLGQIKDEVNQTGIDRKELLSWLIHALISQNIDMAFILLSFN